MLILPKKSIDQKETLKNTIKTVHPVRENRLQAFQSVTFSRMFYAVRLILKNRGFFSRFEG
jgi:hypothetical protein